MTKKFFVGDGKKRRPSPGKPADPEVTASGDGVTAPAPTRRFLVGAGKKLAPATAPAPDRNPVTPPNVSDDRPPGCICRFPFRVGHVPDCRYFEGALFVCETADLETMQQLAASGKTTVAELEWRRHGFVGDFGCPDQITASDPRRRCPSCPFWNRTTDVPFQLDYENVQ